jgi:hypothetical protein
VSWTWTMRQTSSTPKIWNSENILTWFSTGLLNGCSPAPAAAAAHPAQP